MIYFNTNCNFWFFGDIYTSNNIKTKKIKTMKNQKTESFKGNYILPFGKPIVIVTGWETETDLYCERFVMFEKRDGTMLTQGSCTHISKADYNTVYTPKSEERILSDFMMQEGQQLAEADTFSIIVEMMEKIKNWELAVNMEIHLYPTKYILPNLVYLNKKFPNALNWLEQNTQLPMLKELIKLAKRFTPTEDRY
jgi:hypothetical protein